MAVQHSLKRLLVYLKRSIFTRSRPWIPLLITLGIGLAVTGGLFQLVRHWEQNEKQSEFDFASQHFVEAIRRASERLELTHEIMRQDFYGSPHISREEFALCSEPILARVPSLKVLQWAPRVSESERAAFEQAAQRAGMPKYRIVQPDSMGRLVPVGRQSEHFPIWFSASKCGFQSKFGWDFASIPVLQKSIDTCRDTGNFVISGVVDLSKIGIPGPMLQTFMPVYDDFENVRTVEDRRKNLKGMLVGLCDVDDLVERAISYAGSTQGIDMAVFDESATNGGRLLHFHVSRTRSKSDDSPLQQAEIRPAGIHHTELFSFGQRRWSLVCTPAPYFFTAHASWRSWTFFMVGMTVTCLSGVYVWSASTRTERIEQIVEDRTQELIHKDEQLRQSQETKAKAIRTAHEETIHRLVTASLCRDEETGMHIKRTGLLAELLARAVGWSEADAEIIRLAAPMHDVGKIGIPDAVLQKPGKLTPDEFKIMKTHTIIGAKMLEGSQSAILAMARDIALCHHERWDGTGYPRGLSGTQIPEPARILSIVDVYDALSHDRVYRPALPEDEVMELMAQGSGTQFDAELLAVFLAHYEDVLRITHENPDELATEELDVSSILSLAPLSVTETSPDLLPY